MSDETFNTGSSDDASSAAEAVSHIVCGEIMDISTAAELHGQLLDALAAGNPVSLDGSAVERADTAVLQVFAAFFQDAQTKDIAVTWSASSEALTRSAALLGLGETLGLQTLVA